MKTILTIWILTFFTLGIYSQEIKRVNTKDLITISNNFGLDSALHLSHGFPIYKIDSITALELLDKMTSYERYTPSEYFFNAMAHNWINEKVKSTNERLAIQQLNDIKSAKRNDHKRLVVFDDKLMISILQQHIRIEPQLISCYNFCDSLARDQRKNYPSFFHRIPAAFTVESFPIIEDFKASQKNCYNIMRLLGVLKSEYFDSEKLRYHTSELRPFERDKDIFRFKEHYSEYDSVIVNLIGEYNSMDELDFSKEPGLEKLLKDYKDEKCWKFLLQNDKSGFLELGCRFDPLAGFGVEYKLILIEKNKLLLMKIEEWIS